MKFKSFMVDSPWRYKNGKTGGSLKSGAAQKYNTLSYNEIKNLPVKQLVDKKAVMFFWVPTPLKYEIAQAGILEAWGFTYKTTIYWEKLVDLGLGFYYRGNVEECWVCTHGKVTPFRTKERNIIKTIYMEKEWEEELIQSQAKGHSRKPDELWQLVTPSLEKYDLYPLLEMFARESREGQISIGNEITGNDIRDDLKDLIENE